MEYDIDYFIEKFEAIPEEKWGIGKFSDQDGRCCALGHCGEGMFHSTEESNALSSLLIFPAGINDGDAMWNHLGPTPKLRILNFLKSLKK